MSGIAVFRGDRPLDRHLAVGVVKDMDAGLPPNSSNSFLTVPARCSVSYVPTSVELVKVNLRTDRF
jgi:hypothetical protein